MPESAAEKSKRVFIDYLDRIEWSYQFSFIYTSQAEAKMFAIEDGLAVRKAIARAYKHQPFLYRLCLINRKMTIVKDVHAYVCDTTGEIIEPEPTHYFDYEETAFVTFFTTRRIPYAELVRFAEKYCRGHTVVRNRQRDRGKLISYRTKVKKQKPHNLNRFFGRDKINRFALLNKTAYEAAVEGSINDR